MVKTNIPAKFDVFIHDVNVSTIIPLNIKQSVTMANICQNVPTMAHVRHLEICSKLVDLRKVHGDQSSDFGTAGILDRDDFESSRFEI